MARGLRAREHGVVLRAIDRSDPNGAHADCAVPGFIGDGERRYELVREISRGGMGSVHLGLLRGPLGFAKNVAIKTMHAHDAADPQIARIFAAEARLTAGLCHANIVSTLDVLVEGGSVFIVMEYIDGRSLSDLVALAADFGWLLPVDVSCAIMHDVLMGLDHAHNAGVIHCDISPQNVLVGVDGLSRVVDFGIAKVASSARNEVPDQDNTEIRGKVPYMAPEQLRGGKMDHRVDLYAAGATLWELLTGRRLFRGANRRQIAANVLHGNVEPPSRHLAQVPPALDDFVMRATQRDPRARFRSAREMANALAAAMPLASREGVIAAMCRLEMRGTPGSGVRALSPDEIAIRQHARALRAQRNASHSPLAITMLEPPIPEAQAAPNEPRRTTMSEARKKARASLRMKLVTVGLIGIALGAAQAVFDVLPLDPYIERVIPSTWQLRPAAKPTPRPALTAVPMPPVTVPPVATPLAVPVPQPTVLPSVLPTTNANANANAKTQAKPSRR